MTGGLNVAKNAGLPSVAIPPAGAAGPTGQVANGGSGFGVTGTGSSALFIFANLNGSISAWNGSAGTTAVTERTTPGATYTGLAINSANSLLYAANDAGTGSIDVFNSSFAPATNLPAGAFATPAAIKTAGLVPFNVKDINGAVYVTYAPSGHAAQTGATKGMGALAVFSEDGTLESSSFVADELASPWGLALAPAIGVSSAATCWLAISLSATASSTPSTRRPGRSRARSRSTTAASPRAVSGRWRSAAGATTETRRRCSSLTVSTAKRMASWRRSPPFLNRRPGR